MTISAMAPIMCVVCAAIPKAFSDKAASRMQMTTMSAKMTLLTSIAPMVKNTEKIRYPKKAKPNWLTSAAAANSLPKTPIFIIQQVATAYQKKAYAPNVVAPQMFSCRKSKIEAISWAVAPRKIAYTMTKESPVVIPSFCDDATKVTMARPNRPRAVGLATEIFICCLSLADMKEASLYYSESAEGIAWKNSVISVLDRSYRRGPFQS